MYSPQAFGMEECEEVEERTDLLALVRDNKKQLLCRPSKGRRGWNFLCQLVRLEVLQESSGLLAYVRDNQVQLFCWSLKHLGGFLDQVLHRRPMRSVAAKASLLVQVIR